MEADSYNLTPVRNAIAGAPVYYLESTDSTMQDAADLARRGAVHGTVVWAGFQRKGRGRIPGRVWDSDGGSNLLFTVILSMKELKLPHVRLPLLAGLATALLLEDRFALKPAVKWPNDVLLDGKKVSGILCESRDTCVLAGIGINCNQKVFNPEITDRATSIALHTGSGVDTAELLQGFLTVLSRLLYPADPDPDSWRRMIEERLYMKNRSVVFLAGSAESPERLRGVIAGLDEGGGLVVRPEDGHGPQTFFSGEIAFP